MLCLLKDHISNDSRKWPPLSLVAIVSVNKLLTVSDDEKDCKKRKIDSGNNRSRQENRSIVEPL